VANGSVKWIIALCISIALAVMGWTVTGTLAIRMKAFEATESEVAGIKSNVAANNIRISVMENRFDTIQLSLADIKALITTHMRDTR
jgi:hypothetical protein